MADVGNKKLFENDRVVVWELLLEPGESTGVHTLKHDYFFQVLEGSTLRTLTSDGESLGDFEFATESTVWLDSDGDELVFGDARCRPPIQRLTWAIVAIVKFWLS